MSTTSISLFSVAIFLPTLIISFLGISFDNTYLCMVFHGIWIHYQHLFALLVWAPISTIVRIATGGISSFSEANFLPTLIISLLGISFDHTYLCMVFSRHLNSLPTLVCTTCMSSYPYHCTHSHRRNIIIFWGQYPSKSHYFSSRHLFWSHLSMYGLSWHLNTLPILGCTSCMSSYLLPLYA